MNDQASRAEQQPATGEAPRPAPGSFPTRVTAVAGAITAVGAFTVIPASAAMWVRLGRADLPADPGIIASLPDRFLIAFGLPYVIVPLLVLVSLALAIIWLPSGPKVANLALTRLPIPGVAPELRSQLLRGWMVLGLFYLGLTVGLPFAVFGGSPPGRAFLWSLATAVVFAVLSSLVAQASQRWRAKVATEFGLLALVAALLMAPWAVAFGGVRAAFPAVTVCLEGGNRLDGVLIGRTSDDVYVGEPEIRVTLLAIEDDFTRNNITGGLRAAGWSVNHVPEDGAVTYQRTRVLIADLGDGLEQLVRPQGAEVPVLAYYDPDDPEKVSEEEIDDAERAGVQLITEEEARRPSALRRAVEGLLEPADAGRFSEVEGKSAGGAEEMVVSAEEVPKADRPPRRIAAVPASQVTGFRAGAAGPCPVKE